MDAHFSSDLLLKVFRQNPYSRVASSDIVLTRSPSGANSSARTGPIPLASHPVRRRPPSSTVSEAGFERNAAIVAAKEAANHNDETRKRFEVMCREVFKKFKACITVKGINDQTPGV
jgi:hypothetical protein